MEGNLQDEKRLTQPMEASVCLVNANPRAVDCFPRHKSRVICVATRVINDATCTLWGAFCKLIPATCVI